MLYTNIRISPPHPASLVLPHQNMFYHVLSFFGFSASHEANSDKQMGTKADPRLPQAFAQGVNGPMVNDQHRNHQGHCHQCIHIPAKASECTALGSGKMMKTRFHTVTKLTSLALECFDIFDISAWILSDRNPLPLRHWKLCTGENLTTATLAPNLALRL